MKTAIELREVTKTFPGASYSAVDHVSLTVGEGEFVTILGSSGCGKTTLLKTINRLYEPDSGSILLFGEDISTVDVVKLRRRIGYVIQQVGLFPHYTVGENIATVPKLLKWDRDRIAARVDELLTLVGLDPKRTLESYPHELSGGQCQRVIIAMALTRDPSLIICDEPTTALDVTVQKQVIKLLNDLQKKLGFAMIFVSHDLALVAEVASEITVMYAGQVVESAPTKELLTNPRHEYTQGLLGSVLSIEAHDGKRLHQVPGSVPSPADFPKGDRFAPRSSHPTVGLDVKPVMKLVAGTSDHYVAELPDDVLAANGLTTRADYEDPGAVDAVNEIVSGGIDDAVDAIVDTLHKITGEPVSREEALEELDHITDGLNTEGGEE